MTNTPILIDLTYLYSLTGGDKVFERLLLTGTVADVEKKISGLKEAWELKDSPGIRINAHSLISLAAIAGMPQVENWSRLIEKSFVDGVFHPELAILAGNIITGWPAAKSRLEEVIASI